MPKDNPARTAAAFKPASLFAIAHAWASKEWAKCFGAPPAVESGIAAATAKTSKTERPMFVKVSSKRVAEIASRILRGRPYSEREARAVAASVVAQAKGKSAAKKRKR